eukprot:CAMPEP_0182465116 /NCGR_PEP_ID=MMETSP1319-20130603/9009_1 /TAXON_ID=172717 /ORGANISM="Bolidomonas pacifica, Strain RCC208" /LENGTH=188 /DNA_ID=CAMNT_0024664803 /DNA_START=99 /DNA_END=662 /DNA_ORIENTATION=-
MSAALARRRKQKAKAAAAAATGGTETLEARVKTLLSTNDTAAHYEALQLLTSNTHRALKAGDVDKAVSTAYTGTCLLLEAGQVEVGSQMSGTFVETLKDGRVDEEGNIEKVKKISELYKSCPETRDSKKNSYHAAFLTSSLSWSSALGPTTHGNLDLHNDLAEALWEDGDAKRAVVHWVLGEDPSAIC